MQATTVHICSGLMLQRVRTREQAHFSPATAKGTCATARIQHHARQKRGELELFFLVFPFWSPRARNGAGFPRFHRI